MNETKIEPAMTAQEWALQKSYNAHQLSPQELHAQAAICLDGQPFGFTREMLRAVQESQVRDTSERSRLVGAVCRRIEALLPPEEGTGRYCRAEFSDPGFPRPLRCELVEGHDGEHAHDSYTRVNW